MGFARKLAEVNPEIPDNVILPGGEVVPLPLSTANPLEFLGLVFQVQIKIHEAMMRDGMQVWRILWEAFMGGTDEHEPTVHR